MLFIFCIIQTPLLIFYQNQKCVFCDSVSHYNNMAMPSIIFDRLISRHIALQSLCHLPHRLDPI